MLHAEKNTRGRLAQVAAVNSAAPGVYDFALALEQDPRYRLVGSGPVNSGFGSFGAEPSTFFIWQRTNSAPAHPSAQRPTHR